MFLFETSVLYDYLITTAVQRIFCWAKTFTVQKQNQSENPYELEVEQNQL